MDRYIDPRECTYSQSRLASMVALGTGIIKKATCEKPCADTLNIRRMDVATSVIFGGSGPPQRDRTSVVSIVSCCG